MTKKFFKSLLYRLSQQSGEEKLRIAFKLSDFARKLREEGRTYANKQPRLKSRTAA